MDLSRSLDDGGLQPRTPPYVSSTDPGPLTSSVPWYRRAGRGAVAGALATVAMSAVQFPVAAAAGRKPPPVEITHRLHRRSGRRVDRSTLLARSLVLHLAFGAACGAVYGVVAPPRLRELTAPAYAGIVYGLSYRGLLPAVGLHPHSAQDDTRRQIANVTGHLVYGFTLAEVLRWMTARDRRSGLGVRS